MFTIETLEFVVMGSMILGAICGAVVTFRKEKK